MKPPILSRLLSVCAVLVLLSAGAPHVLGAMADEHDHHFALRGVHVIDVAHGTVTRDVTLVIEGRRIARFLTGASARELPRGLRIIDAAGKFVIPGLWDMHVHSFLDERDPDWMFPLMIAHGVTGIRDMGSLVPITRMEALRREIAKGERIGPRVRIAGPVLDGLNTVWQDASGVPRPDEARQAVRLLAAQGADFIKVYSLLSPAAYRAVTGEAQRLGLPVAGQVPETITVAEAVRAGQRSIEHVEKVLLACSTVEEELVARHRRALEDVASAAERLELLTADMDETARMLKGFDQARCERMAASIAGARVAVVPTLIDFQLYASRGAPVADPRLASVPAVIRDAWRTMNAQIAMAPATHVAAATAVGHAGTALIRTLRAGGVPILAGTHAAPITPFVFPGSGLHDELVALRQAGLTNLEALQSATLGPARFFSDERNHGLVASGRLADLVVLDANPLDDVANVRRVHAVVADGRLADLVVLDANPLDDVANVRRVHAVVADGRLFGRVQIDGLLAAVGAMAR